MPTTRYGIRHYRKRVEASSAVAASAGRLRGQHRVPHPAGFGTGRAPRSFADIRAARRAAPPAELRSEIAPSADGPANAAIADALAKLARTELQNLVVAAGALLAEAPDLLAWTTHLADWELKRRAGLRVRAQPADAAIPPERCVTRVVAATMLRDGYAESGGAGSARVVALLDAIVQALTAGGSQRCGPRPQDAITSCRSAGPCA